MSREKKLVYNKKKQLKQQKKENDKKTIQPCHTLGERKGNGGHTNNGDGQSKEEKSMFKCYHISKFFSNSFFKALTFFSTLF